MLDSQIVSGSPSQEQAVFLDIFELLNLWRSFHSWL